MNEKEFFCVFFLVFLYFEAIISGGGVVTASTDDDGRERGRSGFSPRAPGAEMVCWV